MHATHVVILAVLVAASATQAGSLHDLNFHPPARAGPSVAVHGAHWLVLVFSNATGADATAVFPAAAQVQEFKEASANLYADPLNPPTYYPPLPAQTRSVGPADVALAFHKPGPASLYLEAEHITWKATGPGTLVASHQNPCADPAVSNAFVEERAARYNRLCPPSGLVAVTGEWQAPPVQFTLTAENVTVAEWHDAATACSGVPASECPAGGDRQDDSTTVAPARAERRLLTFERLTTRGGHVEAEGSAALVFGGGPTLDLDVVGAARLPAASAPPACPGCTSPDGQTLLIQGNFTLGAITAQPDGTLSAQLAGDVRAAKLDESVLDPASLLGVGAAAGVVAAGLGLAWLVKVLWGALFTKMRPEKAVENDARRAIRDYVAGNPGATFRELRGVTGLKSALLNHHLRVLKGGGLIHEQGHGASRRFLPPGLTSEEQRMKAILLREEPVNEVYELVRRHPWLAQGDLLDLAARELGFSRSTTQHRLGRLVKAGLLVVRHEGRFKLHAVAEAPASFRSVTVPVAPIAVGR